MEDAVDKGFQPNGHAPISYTDKSIDGADYSPLRRLSTEEISQIIIDFRLAARNAMEADLERLFGETLQSCFEIAEAVSEDIGANKVSMRLSIFSDYLGAGD
ncbi:hypothetical protein POM88_021494 [Heracleum sosnowskyi]|uniref:Uncharacterized protein n=1 Tax=Heracleum sosnowskyi TaxID=360622 RepID=A0AAD8IEY1_9APIA|nr:hypothetical protein POM88_021494 [Heracleum sosnowskyi]